MEATIGLEALSACTLDEIVEMHHKNRARKKDLRVTAAALVVDRLAKVIGAEEYAIGRKAGKEGAEECTRWGSALLDEIASRSPRYQLLKSKSYASEGTPRLAA